jgi:uroporphyrin-III C-methyltransferase
MPRVRNSLSQRKRRKRRGHGWRVGAKIAPCPHCTGRSKASFMSTHPPGKVTLVGAGPGAADLLTLRAVRALATADVVVFDQLVGAEVLALVPPTAQRLYAGKERSKHSLPQGELNQLLVNLARQGKQVVRLKGGDPFVFGRGGEELQALAAAGIAFEAVPGITAACGMASMAGIPLTHRDYAQACVFVTGHLKDNRCDLDWPALARPGQTLVIYMGLGGLAHICQQLVAHGLPTTWPAAVVADATLPSQRVVTATLADLAQAVAQADLKSPCLTVVGQVVLLRAQLAAGQG